MGRRRLERAMLRLSRFRPAAFLGRQHAVPFLQRCNMSLKYSKEHEWVKVEGDTATVGITDHAQEQLGDVVYVELPTVGAALEQHATMGAVESVKAASDVYSPLSGEVTEVNEKLNEEPSLINSSAEDEGWLAKIKMSAVSELDGLMDKAGYDKFCEES